MHMCMKSEHVGHSERQVNKSDLLGNHNMLVQMTKCGKWGVYKFDSPDAVKKCELKIYTVLCVCTYTCEEAIQVF